MVALGDRSRGLDEPLPTQHTSQAAGVVFAHVPFVDSYQGAARPVNDTLPTQLGSETMALVTPLAVGIKHTGAASEAGYPSFPITEPLGAVVSSAINQGLLFHPTLFTNRGTGHSINHIATACGVSRQAVQQWMRKRRPQPR